MKKHILAVITILMIYPQIGSASGYGRNGANFSGESIPMQVDRTLTKEDLERATHVCLVELSKSLIKQFTKNNNVTLLPNSEDNPNMGPFSYRTFGYHSSEHDPSFESNSKIQKNNISSTLMQTFIVSVDTEEFGGLSMFLSSDGYHQFGKSYLNFAIREVSNISLTGKISAGDRFVALDTDKKFLSNQNNIGVNYGIHFPFLKFNLELDNPVFDEYGELVSNVAAIKNLQILRPMASFVTLYKEYQEEKALAKTSIKINIDDHVDCLKSELKN